MRPLSANLTKASTSVGALACPPRFATGQEGPALHAGASSGVRYRRGGGVVSSPYCHHGERECGADDDEQRGEAAEHRHHADTVESAARDESSEERRGGKRGVRTCRKWGSPSHK